MLIMVRYNKNKHLPLPNKHNYTHSSILQHLMAKSQLNSHFVLVINHDKGKFGGSS